MKQTTKSKISKLIIFALLFALSLLTYPDWIISCRTVTMVSAGLIVSTLMYASTIKFFSLKYPVRIEKPKFQNRLSNEYPLTIYQFLYYCLIVLSAGQFARGVIQYSEISILGVWLMSTAIGIRLSWYIEEFKASKAE